MSTKNTKILLVEDDEMLNAGICFHLEKEGYCPASAFNLKDARHLFAQNDYTLALIDINLPDGNGLDLGKELSQNTPATPVIFLTARDTEEDILQGFDAGAVDYITKPFSIPILLKRIEVAAGRSTQAGTSIKCGNLAIDLQKGLITKQGEKLSITAAEWKLLRFFLANPGQVLSRNILLEALWDIDGAFVEEHALTSLISRLRTKLADGDYQYIKTLYGMGYKWTGDADE